MFKPDTKYMTAGGNKAQVLLNDAPGGFPIVGFVIVAGERDFSRWAVDGTHQTDANQNLVPWTITVSPAMTAAAAESGVPAAQRIRNTIRVWVNENHAMLKDIF